MNDKKADLGEQLLLNENAKHTLEVEYNTDMEQVFIQLRNKADGKCTVLNADSIFEQAYDFLTKKHENIMTQHTIRMDDGEAFTGEPEDIARWYCKLKHVKLYIEPNMDNGAEKNSSVLLGAFPDRDTLTHIAYFENGDDDVETAYRLFFSEYMLECYNPDYELTELS